MAKDYARQVDEKLRIAITPELDLTSAAALDPATGTVSGGEVTGASTDADMHTMRHQGVSIAGPQNWAASEDIDPDARQSDMIHTGETGSLSWACDWRFGSRGAVGATAEDPALVGSLHMIEQMASGNRWTDPVAISSSAVTASNAAGVNTLVGAAGDFDDLVGNSAITGQPIVPCPMRLIRAGATAIDDLVTVLSISGALAAVQTLVIGSGDASGGGDLSDGHPGVDVGAVAAGDLVTLEHDGVLKTNNADQWALGERAVETIVEFRAAYGNLVSSIGWTVTKGSAPQVSITMSARNVRNPLATSGSGTVYEGVKFPPFEAGDKFIRYAIDGVEGMGLASDGTTGFRPRQNDFSLAPEVDPVDGLGQNALLAQLGNKRIWTGTTELFATNAARAIVTQALTAVQVDYFFAVQQTDAKAATAVTHMEAIWFPCISFTDASAAQAKVGATSFPWSAGVHPTLKLEFAKARFATTTAL